MVIIAPLRRPLLFLVCTTIVAAIEGHLAASAAVSEDVPVPGGVAALAEALDIRPVPDRARFLSEVARLIHGPADRRAATIPIRLQKMRLVAASAGAATSDLVPVPLSANVWSDAIFHRRVAPGSLIVEILSDRQAALLAYGLSGLDDETLEYIGQHQGLLSDLYARSAPAFAAFGGSVRIRSGRVIAPGGDRAVPLWEAALRAKADRPDRFLSELFFRGDGRLAYLYDTIGQLTPERAAFVLGASIDDPFARVGAMQALITAWNGSFRDWRVKLQPFARQPYDAANLLMRVAVDGEGRIHGPSSRELWTRAFESADLPEEATAFHAAPGDRPVDATWLMGLASAADQRLRAERLDQFAFGQRVFADAAAADLPDVFVALRAFRRYRMLMTTLDRIGIRTPAVYAAAARQAARMSPSDAGRAFLATAQFQGALALVSRMVQVGTVDRTRVETLVASLVAIPLNSSGQYGGALARWFAATLVPSLGREDGVESTIVAAVAGPSGRRSAPIVWEGRDYRVDPAGAERRRIERVREKQGGAPLDIGIDLEAQARRLATASSLETVRAAQARVEAIATMLAEAAGRSARDGRDEGLPPGVAPPPDPRPAVGRAADELSRMVVSRDLSRAPRVAGDLYEAADCVTAESLMSLVYALHIGDPEGAPLLAGDVSRRHDFGFGARDGEIRLRAAWAMPTPDVSTGIPWHVDGSVLGLDVALAGLQLHRLSTDRVVDAPTLTSNARDTFAVSVGLMNPFSLSDAARDAIADALDRGRRRLASLRAPADLDRVADELNLDGWRRRAAAWTLVHDADRLESMFSLGEFLALGAGGQEREFDAWGMAALTTSGCVCTVMPAPGGLATLTGRPQTGLLPTSVPDLHLHVARMLAEMRLPALLTKAVLSAAVQDFIDGVRQTDSDDWLSLVRSARAFTRAQIEDYVAAAAADGPLVIDVEPLPSPVGR